ncbi:MAG: hypothetical protein V3R28_03240 [Desulfatiglandales bacterium]
MDRPRGLRKSLITAAVLYIFDAFIINQGAIALITILVVVILFLPRAIFSIKDKPLFKNRLLKATIYFIMAVAIFGSNFINNKIAKYRAERLIEACYKYHNKYQQYPNKLEDLVPDFIPRVPSAKFTLSFNKFRYISSDKHHMLTYVHRPPFGRPFYDFEKGKWGYLD